MSPTNNDLQTAPMGPHSTGADVVPDPASDHTQGNGSVKSADKPSQLTAADVKAAIFRRHGMETSSGEWCCIEEAFCGMASAGGGIDVLALGAWQTAKVKGCPGAGKMHGKWVEGEGYEQSDDARYPVVAYEVKVSRSDFRRELYGYQPGPNASWRSRGKAPWPAKAYWALERSHYFFFATPRGLVKPEEYAQREVQLELAADAGRPLWLPAEAGLIEVDSAGRCHVVVPAPRRKPRTFTPGEVGELVRHALKPNKERTLAAELVYERGRTESLRRRIEQLEGEKAA